MEKIILGLFILSLIILSGCDWIEEQELEGKELVEASCSDLYESMKKCDSTGLRTDGTREQCKTNHLIIIKTKCID